MVHAKFGAWVPTFHRIPGLRFLRHRLVLRLVVLSCRSDGMTVHPLAAASPVTSIETSSWQAIAEMNIRKALFPKAMDNLP